MTYLRTFLIVLLLLSLCQIHAQDTIRGQVVDTLGYPLAFVNIIADNNPYLGTTTDINGSFSIASSVPIQSLSCSFVGFESKRILIDGRLPYNLLFVSSGVGVNGQDFWLRNAFQTMDLYEFLSDQFLHLFFRNGAFDSYTLCQFCLPDFWRSGLLSLWPLSSIKGARQYSLSTGHGSSVLRKNECVNELTTP